MDPYRERLDVLDGLRGCAVVLVVWYHTWIVSGVSVAALNFIAEAGYLGVDLFFFISGFCLYYPYASARFEGRPMPPRRRFFDRRAMKIIPSYVIALGVFAIVYRAQFASPQDALRQLVAHLTFLHPLGADTFGSISGPLWTIGVEVQFYLLFPLIALGFSRAPLVGYLVMAVLAETYRWAVANASLGLPSFWAMNQLPAVLDLFAAGMLGAYAFVVFRSRTPRVDASRATVISFTALLGAIVALDIVSAVGRVSSADVTHAWINAHRVLVGPLCFVIALSSFFAIPAWRSVLTTRALLFCSTISYNLYLWHLEIIVWVHNLGLAPIWTVALAVPLALGVATLFTFAVERPLLRTDLATIYRALAAATRSTNARVRERIASRSISKLPPMSNIVSEP